MIEQYEIREEKLILVIYFYYNLSEKLDKCKNIAITKLEKK